MLETLQTLDRRWIFLAMFLAVAVPLIMGTTFPEEPSDQVMAVFDAVENLPDGSNVVMALDYDPASEGELQPMASAFTRHCALKKHNIYFMTLWPQGGPMIQRSTELLENDYPETYKGKYGTKYVNLGFRAGNEGVIKLVVEDLKKSYDTDVQGTNLNDIPLTKNLKNIQQVDLLCNVSAGYPGSKEWVLYGSAPFDIPTVIGCTGVQAPIMLPYIPQQLTGMLAAIKGAAEYEQAIINAYPELNDNLAAKEGLKRMGPQLVAHVLLICLIALGNVIYFWERKQGTS
ncbi:hypothetical protein [Gimesia aquarii]|uniref:Uncharacterized protein n=1 Tax=Gimesia aquarii TaxID=2527964 RepID=A0A517WXZ7_9PLAN|nr:hypothetical protein [Gimesia aquarii]QDT96558.1 hypothetical protein V144x_20160 [Gimesia aquarii]QDU10131.1 hypothetical protein V202x_35300 [Gimesia aquarii]